MKHLEKNSLKIGKGTSGLCNSLKGSNVEITGAPEGEKEKIEKIFQEKTGKIFTNLMKTIKNTLPPKQMNPKHMIHRENYTKVNCNQIAPNSDKQETLKAAKGERHVTHTGSKTKMT